MPQAVGVPAVVVQKGCGRAAAVLAAGNHPCTGGCVTHLGAGCRQVDTVTPPATAQSWFPSVLWVQLALAET